jgi:hypothetical protein
VPPPHRGTDTGQPGARQSVSWADTSRDGVSLGRGRKKNSKKCELLAHFNIEQYPILIPEKYQKMLKKTLKSTPKPQGRPIFCACGVFLRFYRLFPEA